MLFSNVKVHRLHEAKIDNIFVTKENWLIWKGDFGLVFMN